MASGDAYVGYVKRDADSFINWADIGKTLNEDFKAAADDRETRRKAIEDESRRMLGKLSNERPQGDDVNNNKFIADYADEATQAELTDLKLLKSGQMKLKDYNARHKNRMDGTQTLFTLSNKYNKTYADAMARATAEDPANRSQFMERWLLTHLGRYADLNNSKAIIDPSTGMVAVARLVDDPNNPGKKIVSTNPSDISSVNSVYDQVDSKFNYYDADKDTRMAAKDLGSRLKETIGKEALAHIGSVTSVDDIAKTDGYKKWKQGWIESRMANEFNITSVLTDHKTTAPDGEPYTYTFDPKEANDHTILLEKKPEWKYAKPVITDKNKEVFEEYLGTLLDAKVDDTIKKKEFVIPQNQQRSEAEIAWEKMKSDAKNFGYNLKMLITGDANQTNAAGRYFEGVPGVASVTKGGESITVNYKDGTTETLSTKGLDADEAGRHIVRALAKHADLPEDAIIEAMQAVNKGAAPTFQQATSGSAAPKAQEEAKIYEPSEVASAVKQAMPSDVFQYKGPAAAEMLQPIAKALGIQIIDASSGLNNYIRVVTPNAEKDADNRIGTNAWFSTSEFDNKFMNIISKYISSLSPDERAGVMKKLEDSKQLQPVTTSTQAAAGDDIFK